MMKDCITMHSEQALFRLLRASKAGLNIGIDLFLQLQRGGCFTMVSCLIAQVLQQG